MAAWWCPASDHIVRPYFISRGARLPFLLTVLGVLGGVLAFGVLGIFLGPVLLGVGFTLVMEFIRAERQAVLITFRYTTHHRAPVPSM